MSGLFWGLQNRPKPGRQAQSRLQVSSDHRRWWCPARLSVDRPPTATTSPNCCRCSTRSRPSAASPDALGAGHERWSETAATTPRPTAWNYALDGSRRGSPSARPSTAQGSASNDGSSNERSPGCTSTVASASATSDAPTSTKPSSRSPAASSASNNSNGARFVRRSKQRALGPAAQRHRPLADEPPGQHR